MISVLFLLAGVSLAQNLTEMAECFGQQRSSGILYDNASTENNLDTVVSDVFHPNMRIARIRVCQANDRIRSLQAIIMRVTNITDGIYEFDED